jgi:hypothetical protein
MTGNVEMICSCVIAFVVLVGGVAGTVRWAHNHALANVSNVVSDIRREVADIRKELHPNNGQSLADSIHRNEDLTKSTSEAVEALTERFNAHLDYHMERGPEGPRGPRGRAGPQGKPAAGVKARASKRAAKPQG